MQQLRTFWWVFALRGGFAVLFAALLAFSRSLLGTIFFDPVLLVFLSLLLGFFVLGNGLILGVAAIYSLEHHLRLWRLLFTECFFAILIGLWIALSLRTTSHSLALLAAIHALGRVSFQLRLSFTLRSDYLYAGLLIVSAVVSLAIAALFLTHREDSIATITTWLAWYELLFGAFLAAFALGLHRQPRRLA